MLMSIVDIEMSDANVGLLNGTTSSEYNEKTVTTYDKRDKNLDLLNKDRLQLLVKNKEEICWKINITTDILDVLETKSVITTDDKQIIMVNIPLLFDFSLYLYVYSSLFTSVKVNVFW